MLRKALIYIAILIFAGITFFGILSYISPTRFAVEREVTINRPKNEVFEYVKLIKNQNEWGPWYKKEPTMKQEFRGTDGQVGFVSYWKGTTEEVGEGEQEIKRIVEGERVDTELRFKQPFESKADAFIITEDAGGTATKVRWGFSGDMPRPMNLFLWAVDLDKEVGRDYEQGLADLKAILEKR